MFTLLTLLFVIKSVQGDTCDDEWCVETRVPYGEPLSVFEVKQHSTGTANFTVFLPGIGSFPAGTAPRPRSWS